MLNSLGILDANRFYCRYAAEEAGLLGSVDVWKKYKADGKNAKAMLQQDMTGYSKGTTDKGKPEVVGVITDFVDEGLTTFITQVIDAVSSPSFVYRTLDTNIRNGFILIYGSTATSATS